MKILKIKLLFLIMLFFIAACNSNNKDYENAAKKMLYFKGKTLICKGENFNKYNSNIINNNIYKNGKIKYSLSDCRIK